MAMIGGTAVYVLVDPTSLEVRYVGYSSNLKRRYWDHCNLFHRTPKCSWVKSLQNRGLQPVLRIVCIVERHEACRVERALIAAMRCRGVRLTNSTDGGDGLINPTVEVRAKLGRRYTPDERKRHSLILRATFARPEIRAKFGQHCKGKPRTAEHRAKTSEGLKRWAASTPLEQRRRKCGPRPHTSAAISAGLKRAWARRKRQHGNA